MSIPAIIALTAVLVLVVLVAAVVLMRRRRCARLCARFAAAAVSGRFDEAEAIAGRWFDATTWTGIGHGEAWADRVSRLRPRRSRASVRSQSRPDIRRRSVS